METKIQKLSWKELVSLIHSHNESNNITHQFGDKSPLICYVVFNEHNFTHNFTLEERTYHFRSDNKFFIPNMCGNSIFAYCDSDEDCIRLDLNEWSIDYCYIK